MNKSEWQRELQNTRNNRAGIGMYTLDSFDEEVSVILAEYDKELELSILNSIYEVLNDKNIHSKDDIKIMLHKRMNEVDIEREEEQEKE